MGNTEPNEQILEFFKRIEPVTRFFHNIDNNSLVGLLFILAVLLFILGWCWWILFKGGAEKWREGFLKINTRTGLNIFLVKSMTHPIILKIVSAIILISAIIGFFLILKFET